MTNSAENDAAPTLHVDSWSATLMTLLANQLILLSLAAILTSTLVFESRQVVDMMELAVPVSTELFYRLGTGGIWGIVFVTWLVSAIGFVFRKSVLSVAWMSLSFIGASLVLCAGVYFAVAPVLVAVRSILPR